ncbi:MAG: hypothetical protein ACRDRM_12070, partial [Pseudonocardiaceae bacterium]
RRTSMRTIGLVAAAAAGMIAPLAIAMPALAGTEAPLLAGVSSVIDGNNGPDNGDDNLDDNGDDNFDDNGPHNGPDNGDDNFDDNRFGDDNDDADVNLRAAQNSLGDVSILVEADDFTPRTGGLEVSSASLENACVGDVSFNEASTDRYGTALFTVDADDCVPGDYRITVIDPDTPGDSASGEVSIF